MVITLKIFQQTNNIMATTSTSTRKKTIKVGSTTIRKTVTVSRTTKAPKAPRVKKSKK